MYLPVTMVPFYRLEKQEKKTKRIEYAERVQFLMQLNTIKILGNFVLQSSVNCLMYKLSSHRRTDAVKLSIHQSESVNAQAPKMTHEFWTVRMPKCTHRCS